MTDIVKAQINRPEFPSLDDSAREKLTERGIDAERSYREMQERIADPALDSSGIVGRMLAALCYEASPKLTPPLIETLRLISEGMSDEEVARARHVSPNTTKSQVKRLLALLEAKNRAHAVAIGYQRGLLQ